MDYKITGESLVKALKIGRDSDSSCVRWHELCDLLEKLLVPVEKAEGWVRGKKHPQEHYCKGHYTLIKYNAIPEWNLWDSKADAIIKAGLSNYTKALEAQSWADEQIALYSGRLLEI